MKKGSIPFRSTKYTFSLDKRELQCMIKRRFLDIAQLGDISMAFLLGVANPITKEFGSNPTISVIFNQDVADKQCTSFGAKTQ